MFGEVKTAQELRDGGDIKEIVCISEETHSGDDNGFGMVPLGASCVECFTGDPLCFFFWVEEEDGVMGLHLLM